MPNWVTNHVHLECENEDTILKINEFLKSEERDIDFNNIVEMPEVMRTTESGSRTDDAWDYYQAKILGNKAPMENRLEWPWVKREGLKTIEELMDYLLKRDPDILKTGEELYEIHKVFGCHDWYTWACH